ncbi:tetratricopeptide repeat protein [Sphingomonas sp. ID1715]|uniref:tetratricopeptide repeat protein n=1 Tax=Sphingomonas sp. ID1715 TaxID=1656898 RepID=UPI0014892549|nr:tetratricopeptide repeat protein [Sphingomonas sp. ID1715]NNM75497.1 tetratricopeptide repeat protein [Sphingomonas sp. ID1715]
MVRPIAASELKALKNVQIRLRAGDLMGALDAYEALPPGTQAHPNGLLARGAILHRFGKLPEAREAFEQGIALAPASGALLDAYGSLLDDLGEGEAAVSALRRAVEIAPDNSDFLINLGIVAANAGRFDVGEEALETFIRRLPKVARGWAALAHLEAKRGMVDVAEQLYRRAIEIDPEDVRSRHNLAVLLRQQDEPEKALAETSAAVALPSVPVETATLHAHLLAQLDRSDQAVKAYRDIIQHAPEHADAHETLAKLLPQLGRGDEALQAYRWALGVRPDSAALWSSALRTAFDLRDFQQLGEWAMQAARAVGPHPEIRIARAAALSRLGKHAQAIDILRDVVARSPELAVAHQHLAHCLVAAGEPKPAEAHALKATKIDALDQAPWALLTVIWRLLDDPREHWLADYERLVMPVDLDAAEGFFPELAAGLTELHTMREHPAEQSLRGGTQTRGNLFDRKDPLIQRLVAQVRTGVQNRLRQLPDDPTHPFLSRKASAISFPASWSVRLRSEGFHISHIHQTGWMSSALYVSLPAEVGQGEAGALAFGIPDATLGLDLPPRRVELPKVGRLVIFPSYMWHGTLPFESDQPRLTVAFDALPV